MADNDAVTKKDLLDWEARVDAKMDARIDALEARLTQRFTEAKVREAQTEILRALMAVQQSNSPRMRKMETSYWNIDTATSQRLEHLEAWMFQVEKKLMLGNR